MKWGRGAVVAAWGERKLDYSVNIFFVNTFHALIFFTTHFENENLKYKKILGRKKSNIWMFYQFLSLSHNCIDFHSRWTEDWITAEASSAQNYSWKIEHKKTIFLILCLVVVWAAVSPNSISWNSVSISVNFYFPNEKKNYTSIAKYLDLFAWKHTGFFSCWQNKILSRMHRCKKKEDQIDIDYTQFSCNATK